MESNNILKLHENRMTTTFKVVTTFLIKGKIKFARNDPLSNGIDINTI